MYLDYEPGPYETIRTCPVCHRDYITNKEMPLDVCNGVSCQVVGRVRIIAPQTLFPKLDDFEFFWNKNPKRSFHPVSVRFTENSFIVVIIERYDPSNGFLADIPWQTKESAFVLESIESGPDPLKPEAG